MSKIIWDQVGKRFFETGVDHGVLYPQDANGAYPAGFAWNGLTAVTESPSGAESEPIYADNMKYVNITSVEEFGATIEAYTYPDEFIPCDGAAEPEAGVTIGQQGRKAFGLCYRTKIGNDVNSDTLGYKLHLIYGAQAGPSEKAYSTINESPEAITMSWEITTTPVPVTGFKPTSSLVIDSTKVTAGKMAAIELILFGKDATTDPVAAAVAARLPLPDEVLSILAAAVG